MQTVRRFLVVLLGVAIIFAGDAAAVVETWCGRVVGTGFGPLTRCWKTDGVPNTTVTIGNRAILNCTWTNAGSYSHHDGNTTKARVLSSAIAFDGSGTHKFVGSPKVWTALGDVSYGEQRKPGQIRWGAYVWGTTNRFYPETGWMSDLGNTTSCGDIATQPNWP